MAYGTVKVDNVTFTYNAVDATTTFSGFYASTTNNLTLSGTASANTFTGTTANFTNTNAQNISVTTLLSGLAITGGTAGFTTVTGTTVTGTTANFVTISGTSITGGTAGFTTVTGTTVTGTTAQFTSITGGTAGFTTVTGTTVTGTTANFVTVSGTTVTGNIGQFTSLAGATTTMTSGVFASGTEPLPSISFVSDPNTGIYSPGADQLAVATNGVGALFVTASGNIGVQTGSPTSALDISYAGGTSSNDKLTLKLGADVGNLTSRTVNTRKFAVIGAANYSNASKNIGMMYLDSDVSTSKLWFGGGATGIYDATEINFVTAATTTSTAGLQRMVIDSSGRLGIGTSTPVALLQPNGTVSITGGSGASSANGLHLYFDTATNSGNISAFHSGVDNRNLVLDGKTIGFTIAGSDKARIDGSGRLLVGTSTSDAQRTASVQIASAGGQSGWGSSLNLTEFGASYNPYLVLQRSRNGTIGSHTVLQSGDLIGGIQFNGSDGDSFEPAAAISAFVDGTPGANDMPGRLVFSTTADGSASPTERWRIDSSGSLVGVAGSAFVAPYVYNTTTATGANVNVDASGFLLRSTSSIKYKTNVETIQDQYADAILGCRPVWYQSTCEADKPEWGHWGFIAEEVAEIDPRLCFFKEEEDGTLEPEGVQYDRFVPHLLNLIKRQSEAIAELQAEVAALKAN